MKFEDLGLAESLVRSVRTEGYHTATEIQAAAIPPILAGRDLLGCAQTGTGKTAAFALPTLHRLGSVDTRLNGRGRKVRALVLAPTRELALQIGESFKTYGRHTGLRAAVIYGGVGQSPQVRALNGGVDILVATPGRLLDLMQQGFVDLSKVEMLILDEADRMLDMGFIHDLRRIVAQVPKTRQTLLFSATMPASIRKLAQMWQTDPVDIRASEVSSTAQDIEQSVFFVEKEQKLLLLTHWLQETAWTRILVFTRTKHGADKLAKSLIKAGIQSDAIHGNKSQSARQRALLRFKQPKPLVLVATDLAARGLDVDQISHVVNYDMPMDPESYVHRVGRTGRAGAKGVAVSFCDRSERSGLQVIQKLTRQTLAVGEKPASLKIELSAQRSSGSMAAAEPNRSETDRPSRGRGSYNKGGGASQRRRASGGPAATAQGGASRKKFRGR